MFYATYTQTIFLFHFESKSVPPDRILKKKTFILKKSVKKCIIYKLILKWKKRINLFYGIFFYFSIHFDFHVFGTYNKYYHQ